MAKTAKVAKTLEKVAKALCRVEWCIDFRSATMPRWMRLLTARPYSLTHTKPGTLGASNGWKPLCDCHDQYDLGEPTRTSHVLFGGRREFHGAQCIGEWIH